MSALQMRSPAPRANAGDRAESNRNAPSPITLFAEPEAGFAALYVARRFHLAPPIPRAVVTLGRAFA